MDVTGQPGTKQNVSKKANGHGSTQATNINAMGDTVNNKVTKTKLKGKGMKDLFKLRIILGKVCKCVALQCVFSLHDPNRYPVLG